MCLFLKFCSICASGIITAASKRKIHASQKKTTSGLHSSPSILGGRIEYIKGNMNCPFIDAIHYNDESSW